MKKYEALSKAPKDVDVLKWWHSQSAELPIMYKIACHHLRVPVSSPNLDKFQAHTTYFPHRRGETELQKDSDRA